MACVLIHLPYQVISRFQRLLKSPVPMKAIYPIGFSVFLYGLIAGYYAYSAIHNSAKSPDKVRRRLLAALVFGFGAILLGWVSFEFFR